MAKRALLEIEVAATHSQSHTHTQQAHTHIHTQLPTHSLKTGEAIAWPCNGVAYAESNAQVPAPRIACAYLQFRDVPFFLHVQPVCTWNSKA
jgi:hypothetical protein